MLAVLCSTKLPKELLAHGPGSAAPPSVGMAASVGPKVLSNPHCMAAGWQALLAALAAAACSTCTRPAAAPSALLLQAAGGLASADALNLSLSRACNGLPDGSVAVPAASGNSAASAGLGGIVPGLELCGSRLAAPLAQRGLLAPEPAGAGRGSAATACTSLKLAALLLLHSCCNVRLLPCPAKAICNRSTTAAP